MRSYRGTVSKPKSTAHPSRKLVDQPVLLSELSQSLLFAQFQLSDAEGQFLTDLQSALSITLHTTDGLLHFSRFLFLAAWPSISITKFTPLKSYALSSLFERENEYAQKYGIIPQFHFGIEPNPQYPAYPNIDFSVTDLEQLPEGQLAPLVASPSTLPQNQPFHYPHYHPHLNSMQFIKHNILLSNSIYKYYSLEDVLEEPSVLVSELHNHPRILFSARHQDFSAIVQSYLPCGFFLLRIWAHIESIRLKLEQLQHETHKYLKTFPDQPTAQPTPHQSTFQNPIEFLHAPPSRTEVGTMSSAPSGVSQRSRSTASHDPQSADYGHHQAQSLLHLFQLYFAFNIEFNQVINDIYMWFYRNPVLVQLLEDVAYDFINLYDSFHPQPPSPAHLDPTLSSSSTGFQNIADPAQPTTPVTRPTSPSISLSISHSSTVPGSPPSSQHRRRTKVNQSLDSIHSLNSPSSSYIPSLRPPSAANSTNSTTDFSAEPTPHSHFDTKLSLTEFSLPPSSSSQGPARPSISHSTPSSYNPYSSPPFQAETQLAPPPTITNVSNIFLLAPPSPPANIAKSPLFLSNLRQLLEQLADEFPLPTTHTSEDRDDNAPSDSAPNSAFTTNSSSRSSNPSLNPLPYRQTIVDFSQQPIFPNLTSLDNFITTLFELQLETFAALLPLHQFWSLFQNHFLAAVNHTRVFEYLDLNDFFYGLVTTTDPYTNKTSNQNDAIVSYVLQLSRMQQKDKNNKSNKVADKVFDKSQLLSQPFDFDKYHFEHSVGGLDIQHWVNVEMELKNDTLSLFYLPPTAPPAESPLRPLLEQPQTSNTETCSTPLAFSAPESNITLSKVHFDPYHQTQAFEINFESSTGSAPPSLELVLPDTGLTGFYPI